MSNINGKTVFNKEPNYRPILKPEVEKKVQDFVNRLGLNYASINKSAVNNFFVSVGVEVLNRSIDRIADDFSKVDFKQDFIKTFF